MGIFLTFEIQRWAAETNWVKGLYVTTMTYTPQNDLYCVQITQHKNTITVKGKETLSLPRDTSMSDMSLEAQSKKLYENALFILEQLLYTFAKSVYFLILNEYSCNLQNILWI